LHARARTQTINSDVTRDVTKVGVREIEMVQNRPSNPTCAVAVVVAAVEEVTSAAARERVALRASTPTTTTTTTLTPRLTDCTTCVAPRSDDRLEPRSTTPCRSGAKVPCSVTSHRASPTSSCRARALPPSRRRFRARTRLVLTAPARYPVVQVLASAL